MKRKQFESEGLPISLGIACKISLQAKPLCGVGGGEIRSKLRESRIELVIMVKMA